MHAEPPPPPAPPTDERPPSPASSSPAPSPTSSRSSSAVARLGLLLALFVALTALGIAWKAPRGAGADLWRGLRSLPLATDGLVVLLALALVGSEAARFVAFGRALGVRVGWRTALDATVANNFFSWLSPMAMLGEPSAIYMLGRRGVPWDAAALIAFGKFATSFVFIIGLSCALVAAGMGPPIATWVLAPFVVATGTVALILGLCIAGAFSPAWTRARIDALEGRLVASRIVARPVARRALATVAREARGAVERLAAFRRGGARGSALLLGSHALYYALFVGIMIVLADGLGAASTARAVPIAIVYQGFVYLVPTPGGAGVGEASAGLFFGKLLPGGGALTLVLLFRAVTFYFQVLLGFAYLPLVGGAGRILRGARR